MTLSPWFQSTAHNELEWIEEEEMPEFKQPPDADWIKGVEIRDANSDSRFMDAWLALTSLGLIICALIIATLPMFF